MPKYGFLTNKCHFSSKFSREFEAIQPPLYGFTLSKPLNSLENSKVRSLLTTSEKFLPVGFRPPKVCHPRVTRVTLQNRVHAQCLSALCHRVTLFLDFLSITDTMVEEYFSPLTALNY